MADLIKMACEYGLRVVMKLIRLAGANEVLYELKNSEIDARAVLMP
jgi:D-arabinose 1-dehydrogenase-like Zn-dependent alcohol dehydrogenase